MCSFVDGSSVISDDGGGGEGCEKVSSFSYVSLHTRFINRF